MAYNLSDKKHNYFYRITNQINWKYYFGIHSTDDLEDGYFGSGKLLKAAIKKHGRENFVLTIIQNYPTRKEASNHERLAVTQTQINDQQCYNVKTGGDNEFTYIMTDVHKKNISIGKRNPSFETRQKLSRINLGRKFPKEFGELISIRKTGTKASEECKLKMSESHLGERNHFFGKCHSNKSKQLMAKNNPKSKKCIIDGELYNSLNEVSRFYCIQSRTVLNRINSPKDKWKFWLFT